MKDYDWLNHEPGPKMLLEALSLLGTKEKLGNANNPRILGWATEAGIAGYTADSIPWCGLFLGVCAHRAGKALPEKPLWARSWALFGTKSAKASLGDVLVFSRNGGGHVGIYVGEDDGCFHILGGNQGDSVSIVRIAKNRLIAARNHYAVAAPGNVRAIKLAANGRISTNEA